MRLWQVGGREFPPLRTSTVITGNLPTPLDSFVGRTEELGVLSDLIKTQRLVTVVGVGGMGKTRLVIEACDRVQSDSPGGVWFVDLALAQSDSAVVEEVASLFGLQAAPGRSVEDRLIEYLEPSDGRVGVRQLRARDATGRRVDRSAVAGLPDVAGSSRPVVRR